MSQKLLPIQGVTIERADVPKFVWNADLIYFDGPFLSLYSKEGKGDVLFFWLDADHRKHRWGVVDVDRIQLSQYLNGDLSLKSILKGARQIYIFESTPTGRRKNFQLIDINQLPRHYWPKDGSFLTSKIASPAAIALREEAPKRFELQLSGEEIFIDDLARIPRLYEQLYSFVYGLAHIERDAVRDKIVEIATDWTGGFSSVRLFNGLRTVTPTIHRARVADLYMASPGEIGMQLLPEMARRIADSVERLGEKSQAVEKRYKDCYAYFKQHGISGFDDEDNPVSERLTPAHKFDISTFVEDFLDDMALKDIAPAFALLEVDALAQLRAILAYYRRARQLREYVDRGILKVPRRSSTRRDRSS